MGKLVGQIEDNTQPLKASAIIDTYLSPEVLNRLNQCITKSEAQHTGEILLCIEADMPPSYNERQAKPRERALSLFGKYRVWDTEHNNGVMLYLLMRPHAIEIVADRALNRCVTPEQWVTITKQLSITLRQEQYEAGLQQALQSITQLLVQHFPEDGTTVRENTVPDAPVLLR